MHQAVRGEWDTASSAAPVQVTLCWPWLLSTFTVLSLDRGFHRWRLRVLT